MKDQTEKQQNKDQKRNQFQFHCINNKYFLGEPIAQGTYGSIYYGVDSNGNLMAFKIVKMNTGKPHIDKSLKQQDLAMKNCQNQYVVKYETSIQDPNQNVKIIVMDLCDYFSLQDIIFLKGHFQEPEAKIYLKNILCGLISMHHFGYSHRDIKSSNICIINDRCVIIDFGCSKQFVNTEPGQKFNLTRIKEATIIGTVINKSPEMLSAGKYTYRTDFYSIGILYYQMLTGVTPFDLDCDDSDEVILQKIHQNIRFIYDKDYISKRIQKCAEIVPSFKKRANPIISKQARNFLQKLIVIDPNGRLSQQEIKNNQYLKNPNQQTDIWDVAKCVFPLKDQNWQKFIDSINANMINNEKQWSPKLKSKQHQQKLTDFRQMTQAEARAVKQKYKQKTARDFFKMNKARIIYFEIKRIKLLITLKNRLKHLNNNYPDLKCQQVIMLISEYCLQRLAYINGQYLLSLRNTSVKPNIYIGEKPFTQFLENGYQEDKKSYLRANPKVSDKQIINKSEQQRNLEYKKLHERLKAKNLFQNDDEEYFFKYFESIYKYSYKPREDDFQWVQFQLFKTIMIYFTKQQQQMK